MKRELGHGLCAEIYLVVEGFGVLLTLEQPGRVTTRIALDAPAFAALAQFVNDAAGELTTAATRDDAIAMFGLLREDGAVR